MIKMSRNVVYIGRKPALNYCQAIIQSLYENKSVKLLARGNAISKAVDAVEITKNRFLDDVEVKTIEIGTEQLQSSNGDLRNVSNLTIILEKADY